MVIIAQHGKLQINCQSIKLSKVPHQQKANLLSMWSGRAASSRAFRCGPMGLMRRNACHAHSARVSLSLPGAALGSQGKSQGSYMEPQDTIQHETFPEAGVRTSRRAPFLAWHACRAAAHCIVMKRPSLGQATLVMINKGKMLADRLIK